MQYFCKNNRKDRNFYVKCSRTAKVKFGVVIEDIFEGENASKFAEIKTIIVNETNLMDITAKMRNTVDEIVTVFNIVKKDLDKKCNDHWI